MLQLRANCSFHWIALAAIPLLAVLLAAPSGAQLALDTFSLKKGLAREAGEAIEDPYDFEACIEFEGEGVDDLSLTVPTDPPEVVSRNNDVEVCFSESFPDVGALDAAFPNSPTPSDPYGFAALFETALVDSIDILYELEEPKAWVDFTNPEDGSEIPPDGSLTITWTPVEKQPCLTAQDCGEVLLVTVESETTEEAVFEGEFDVAGGEVILPAGTLETDDSYQISGMILNSLELADQETGGGEFVTTLTLYEDDNIITVPEPGSLSGSVAALVALVGLAPRPRRRDREA